MARFKHDKLIRIITSASFCALLVAVAPAWCNEEQPKQPATPMEKFQDLTDRASDLAMQAVSLLGINYKRGGNTPETGLDCSGFVRYVFKEAWGTNLPRTSAEISRMGTPIDASELQPGDLVFYNTLRRGFSHVGIYLGDSKFIHAPSSGGQIRIESMKLDYWKKRFNGARRLDDPGRTDSQENSGKPNT